MFLGIDIGSSSSKAALIDASGKLISTAAVNLGTGTDAAQGVVDEVLTAAGITREDVKYSVATGYGRLVFQGADEQITEITCHGKGVACLMPGVRTVIDIGGQDAKVIRIDEKGVVQNFVMNEKCAAGTGRFLEVMARILGCDIRALSGYAEQSAEEVTISSTCTVFAESEVISQLAAGRTKEDVAAGAHRSVAKRVAGLVNRIGIVDAVGMTGGVALNQNLVKMLSAELGHAITVAPDPQCTGAVGAALAAQEKYLRKQSR